MEENNNDFSDLHIIYEKEIRKVFPQFKDRSGILFVGKAIIDVINGSFCITDCRGIRTTIPIANFIAIMLEPGITITHEAIKLASYCGCLLLWVGDSGIKYYSSSGIFCGESSERLMKQIEFFSNERKKMIVIRRLYKFMFGFEPPLNRSLDQLRGYEGNIIKDRYKTFAKNIKWIGMVEIML